MTDRPPGMPRGIFNKNPGNIRKGIDWLGLSPEQTDPDFSQFTDPKYGIRAIARILKNYQRDGVQTLREAIERWAPSVENDTQAYISAVCKACEVGPDDRVVLSDLLADLVPAIIQHENGEQPYDKATIAYGIALA